MARLMWHKGYIGFNDKGEVLTMCDKTCECKGKKAKGVRAFEVFYGTDDTPEWDGVRFPDGSGIIRTIVDEDDERYGSQETRTTVKDFDKYAKSNGWTERDKPQSYQYNLKWTDAA